MVQAGSFPLAPERAKSYIDAAPSNRLLKIPKCRSNSVWAGDLEGENNAVETPIFATGFYRRYSSIFQHFLWAPCLGADIVNRRSNRPHINRWAPQHLSAGPKFIRLVPRAVGTRNL
jgi:hypothetical protein